MERFQGGAGEVTFDDGHWPFVFVTWHGTADVAIVDRYFDTQKAATDRARREGARLVVVSDALDASNPPAVVRKRIGDRSNELGSFEEAHAMSFVVLRNPLVRGALTAIQWFANRPMEVHYVGSCAEAIERGLERLDELGQPRPVGLSAQGYRRPEPAVGRTG